MTMQAADRDIATPNYTGPERRRAGVFGLRFCDIDANEAARHMLTVRRGEAEGAGLFVTPNIQHIALARQDAELQRAMQAAQIVTADGFPVYRYARWRGIALPGRVTGREVIERMFADPAALAGHRCFIVVDSDDTATALTRWMADTAPQAACATRVPPFGFERDVAYCTAMADEMRRFGATLVFLCIGAPKSEIFAHRYRALLPPCWLLCVGQSFRLLLGTTTPPPAILVGLNLEWLWRIVLEPRRMLRRYGPSALGFVLAAVNDLRRR